MEWAFPRFAILYPPSSRGSAFLHIRRWVRYSADQVMKWAVVTVISILIGGCANLPPILERWADLEIATQTLYRDRGKTTDWLGFYQNGRMDVRWNGKDTNGVRWRVRGAWLEIDVENNGSYNLRLRALTWTREQVVAATADGKRSVWRTSRVVVGSWPLPPRPGLWMP